MSPVTAKEGTTSYDIGTISSRSPVCTISVGSSSSSAIIHMLSDENWLDGYSIPRMLMENDAFDRMFARKYLILINLYP